MSIISENEFSSLRYIEIKSKVRDSTEASLPWECVDEMVGNAEPKAC